MDLERKLAELRKAAQPRPRDLDLERQLEHLRRIEAIPRTLPAQRVPRGIEEYVEGAVETNEFGAYFCSRQALPFGRPYGKLRVGDISTADLSSLDILLEGGRLPPSSQVVYLDTETTGLVGGTGTCAFLIGIGMADGARFTIRQFFLRDYPDEKATLAALAEVLGRYAGVITFNGKTFDIPLLETRYALSRLRSPFARMVHLDLLHPARRLWKLRLESCQLTHLESEVLKLGREGDVDGSAIPGIYFDYLRTGNARGLQPVFYHNALDVVTLAALTAEMARAISDGGAETLDSGLDLFSLSRIFERAGVTDRCLTACQRALELGLPEHLEPRALWHLAAQHKRSRQYESAVEIWLGLTEKSPEFSIEALEQLAIYYEHCARDFSTAVRFVETAMRHLRTHPSASLRESFNHRLRRLRRKSEKISKPAALPLDRSA